MTASDSSATLADLEEAQADLAKQIARRDDYDGNNPNKFATNVREAKERVARLERSLKRTGQLPMSAHESVELKLDAAYPSARHKDEVKFEGKTYRRYAFPATKTLSGKVATWDTGWTEC